MESMVNFSFRYKTVFHSLPAVDLETLPISKMELLPTICNDFQSLTIVVKISAEFLNPHMTTKDDYINISNRYWTDPKHVSDRLFVFIRNKMIEPICLSGRTWYEMYRIPLGVEQ